MTKITPKQIYAQEAISYGVFINDFNLNNPKNSYIFEKLLGDNLKPKSTIDKTTQEYDERYRLKCDTVTQGYCEKENNTFSIRRFMIDEKYFAIWVDAEYGCEFIVTDEKVFKKVNDFIKGMIKDNSEKENIIKEDEDITEILDELLFLNPEFKLIVEDGQVKTIVEND